MISDLEEADARQLAKSHRCAEPGCNGLLSVAWGGLWGFNRSILRCGKDPDHKAIKPYFASEREIAMVNASSRSLVKYDTPMGEVEISVETIRIYLCPKATVEEAYIFLQKCRFQRLNPFLGEAYLIVYEGQTGRSTSMIIGKEAHTRRAERHPDYQGMEAGVIVQRGSAAALEEIPGAFVPPGATLLGGWCKVYRKGRRAPDYIAVTLKEYDNQRQQWRRMPATMIRKVAVVQALREAFPSEMAGLQGSDEFALAEEQSTIIEGELAAVGNLSVRIPAGATGVFEDTAHQNPPPREGRDLEQGIDELFPNDDPFPEDARPAPEEPFDPETAPPPPLPDSVHSLGHLTQILKDEGWSITRLEIDVLRVSLDTYIRQGHKLQDAYLAWREHVRKTPA